MFTIFDDTVCLSFLSWWYRPNLYFGAIWTRCSNAFFSAPNVTIDFYKHFEDCVCFSFLGMKSQCCAFLNRWAALVARFQLCSYSLVIKIPSNRHYFGVYWEKMLIIPFVFEVYLRTRTLSLHHVFRGSAFSSKAFPSSIKINTRTVISSSSLVLKFVEKVCVQL